MEISIKELIIILVVMIVSSIIIGYNIVAIIDKKLTNVVVNIPPVNVPKSDIKIGMLRESKGRYQYVVDEHFRKVEDDD